MRTYTTEQWQVEHVRCYPTAQHKRIYARKVTVTVPIVTKAQQILDLIIKGVPLHAQGR
jgi:hypothetical protein